MRMPAGLARARSRARRFVANTIGLVQRPLRVQRLRVLRARRREDVGRRALADLERELVRAREDVARSASICGKHLGQRRGCEDSRAARVRSAEGSRPRGSRRPRGHSRKTDELHRSTITDVALTHAGGAHARLEAELLGRFAGHDRDDARRLGDVDLDPREQPVDLDRADDAAKAVARADCSVACRRAAARSRRAGTRRRLAASRSRGSGRSRSQRRRVSRLMPSARAASAAVSVFLGIAYAR